MRGAAGLHPHRLAGHLRRAGPESAVQGRTTADGRRPRAGGQGAESPSRRAQTWLYIGDGGHPSSPSTDGRLIAVFLPPRGWRGRAEGDTWPENVRRGHDPGSLQVSHGARPCCLGEQWLRLVRASVSARPPCGAIGGVRPLTTSATVRSLRRSPHLPGLRTLPARPPQGPQGSRTSRGCPRLGPAEPAKAAGGGSAPQDPIRPQVSVEARPERAHSDDDAVRPGGWSSTTPEDGMAGSAADACRSTASPCTAR